jgi:hypothetical protein
MSADRHDDEARRLMCGTHPTDADVRVLAAALRAAERRGAERMRKEAISIASGIGDEGTANIIGLVDIDAELAEET